MLIGGSRPTYNGNGGGSNKPSYGGGNGGSSGGGKFSIYYQ